MKRFLLAVALLVSSQAFGADIAALNSNGVTITLTDEPCGLTAVENLPFRATWFENGKPVAGCYGASAGLVLMYWADRTVVAIPYGAFRRVRST